MSKIDPNLFGAREHALDDAPLCPECGAKLQVRHGHKGMFLGCSRYPDCHHLQTMHATGDSIDRLLEGTRCPECGKTLALRKGRYGIFIGCSNYPDCHHIEPHEQAEDTLFRCPVCHRGNLVARHSRHGKIFYACSDYPTCKYSLAYPPVAQSCPDCDWPLLVERENTGGRVWRCPQKGCRYKMDAQD